MTGEPGLTGRLREVAEGLRERSADLGREAALAGFDLARPSHVQAIQLLVTWHAAEGLRGRGTSKEQLERVLARRYDRMHDELVRDYGPADAQHIWTGALDKAMAFFCELWGADWVERLQAEPAIT